MPTPSQAWNDL